MQKKSTYHKKSGFKIPVDTFEDIQKNVLHQHSSRATIPLHRWRKILAAAVVTIVCGVCVWQYNRSESEPILVSEIEYVYDEDFSELTVDEYYEVLTLDSLISDTYVVID